VHDSHTETPADAPEMSAADRRQQRRWHGAAGGAGALASL